MCFQEWIQGGGDSQMAIVTMVMEMNNIIFSGIETHPTKNHDQIEKGKKGTRQVMELMKKKIQHCFDGRSKTWRV